MPFAFVISVVFSTGIDEPVDVFMVVIILELGLLKMFVDIDTNIGMINVLLDDLLFVFLIGVVTWFLTADVCIEYASIPVVIDEITRLEMLDK